MEGDETKCVKKGEAPTGFAAQWDAHCPTLMLQFHLFTLPSSKDKQKLSHLLHIQELWTHINQWSEQTHS